MTREAQERAKELRTDLQERYREANAKDTFTSCLCGRHLPRGAARAVTEPRESYYGGRRDS